MYEKIVYSTQCGTYVQTVYGFPILQLLLEPKYKILPQYR